MTESSEKTDTAYGKRPVWQWAVIYLVIAGIVYGLAYYLVFAKKGGYGSNTSQQSGYSSSSVPIAPSSPAGSSSSTAMQITVTGTDFSFDPATITATMGQPLQITFKNRGKFPHNFTIADLNVQTKTIQPGTEETITFTPDKTGSFEYICTVPGHADRGMKGVLDVK